jgi:hypothetical protein
LDILITKPVHTANILSIIKKYLGAHGTCCRQIFDTKCSQECLATHTLLVQCTLKHCPIPLWAPQGGSWSAASAAPLKGHLLNTYNGNSLKPELERIYRPAASVFFWNSNRQMVSLRRLKFGGTPLHWPKPSDKCDISLKKKTLPAAHANTRSKPVPSTI